MIRTQLLRCRRRQQRRLPLTLSCVVMLAATASVFAQDLQVGEPVPISRCIPITQCLGIIERLRSYGRLPPADYANYIRSLRCMDSKQEVHVNCPYEDELHPRGVQALSAEKCGLYGTDRISFGEEAKLGQFNWMAALKYNDTTVFQCAGSLITKRYVMTAAHCITPQLFGVRLGEHNFDTVIDCQMKGKKEVCTTAEDFAIEKIKSHPGYRRSRLADDVALLKLDREVVFKWYIKPICLPITLRSIWLNSAMTSYLISGWGKTENGNQSNVLLTAQVAYKDRGDCQEIYRRISLSESQICAGGDGNPQDSCKGDSGGPLVMANGYQKTVRMIQYGIVSFGVITCGLQEAQPGVYANVVHYMPWITSNIDSIRQ